MKKLLAVLITWMALMAPLSAQELERIGEWGTPPYHHFEVTGTTLYAVSENGWVDVFDISEPTAPVRGMRLRLEGTPKRCLIDGDRAYVSSGWGRHHGPGYKPTRPHRLSSTGWTSVPRCVTFL